MKKFWFTQCGWIQLCTTVYMGITITNWCKQFHCGVKRDQSEIFIGFRELLEQLALDCFNNHFSTDYGTLAKNIPILDEFNYVETFMLSMPLISPVLILVPHRLELFMTSISTLLYLQTILWWILLLVIIVMLKNKYLSREGGITGMLDVNLMEGCLMEIYASR